MKKIYVLDTNIVLTDPSAITEGFDDNIVILTDTSLQELTVQKGELATKAKEACMVLDDLREKGNLIEGIPNEHGGKFLLQVNGALKANLPLGYSFERPENRIIAACIGIAKKEYKLPVIFVSDNELTRVSATICAANAGVKLTVQSYKNSEIDVDYSGHSDIDVAGSLIDELYTKKTILIPKGKTFYENEFVTLHAGKQSALSIARDGQLKLIREQTLYGGIKPMNYLQTYAIHALKAPPEEIPLVCLLGPAGTAKTFLSLAAGLDETYASAVGGESKYYKMLVSRPNNLTSDPGIGYLPGDMNEKMEPLLAPLYDNMESILMDKGKIDRKHIQTHIEDIFDSIIEITALSYIRGRTLRNTYVFCDEAQNATRNLVKDLITRAGDGTKIVLCGDPDQVDAPHLNAKNNGLVYAVDLMKDSPYSAIIKFDASQSVRSPLAKDAIQRM